VNGGTAGIVGVSGGHSTGSFIGLGGSWDGGSGGDPEEICAKATTKAEFVPANFLFVIDSSGSMNCNPPDGDSALAARCARFPIQEDPSRPSKWEVTKAALQNALAVLVDKPHVSAGLMLFPQVSECGVSSEPSVPLARLDAEHLTLIAETLDGVQPEGETPVAGATILSYAHLAERLRAGTLSGNSFVVLLTDGVETCAPSILGQLTEQDVPNARLFDIRTFVIGAPGSEGARGLLSSVAFEGGTSTSASCVHDPAEEAGDCHLDMTASANFEAELGEALEAIASTEAASCEIEVPRSSSGTGIDLNRVNVTFTPADGGPEQIGNDTSDCSEANGWQYSADYSKIVLCGEACTRARSVTGELSIVLGCQTARVH
jgi:hypothetical protein